ncbi:hypothetical protein [Paenirhodobacter enshiensis]|uniref:hypothetical protein n=1 Tax=Paenirhodobacter enshiensis TaxID=1105367 RepID=UPI0035AD78C7
MFGIYNIDEMLARKWKGYFRVTTFMGRIAIAVNRPGEPEEVILCYSLGHANQVRQALSDEGLTGYVEGAR